MAWMDVTPEIEAALERMKPTPAAQRIGRIHDVQVKTFVKHADQRGFFIEQLKRGDLDDAGRPFISDRPFAQMSRSLVYARGGNPPELIKAFHWHKRQWDYWDIVIGNARVVLVDLRGVRGDLGLADVTHGLPDRLVLLGQGKQREGVHARRFYGWVTIAADRCPGCARRGLLRWSHGRLAAHGVGRPDARRL